MSLEKKIYASTEHVAEAIDAIQFPVTSVNNKTGTVQLTAADVGAATEQFVTSRGYLTTIPSEYVTESELIAKNYATQTYVNDAATKVKNDLLNGAGTAYDTLKELGDLINDNTDALEALETVASNKMDKDNPTGTGSFSLNRKAGSIIGNWSFAEGYNTTAAGQYSHAEGQETIALGLNSHVEGLETTASSNNAHAEGASTKANSYASHAEGVETTASGRGSHAEGQSTIASNYYSHAEGQRTIASGLASHAEGNGSIASGEYSHAENTGKAYGKCSHAEGNGFATGEYSHAEGSFSGTIASGIKITGEINATTYTYTGTPNSKAVVGNRARLGAENYAQIINIDTINKTITVEKTLTPSEPAFEATISIEVSRASGYSSHAEGHDTIASGKYSHAEGDDSEALADASHAEGYLTIASGAYSHAEGDHAKARGWSSHAGGYYTETRQAYSTALGKYSYTNEKDTYYYSHSETENYIYYFTSRYQIFTGTPTQNITSGTFTYPELTTVTGADIVEGTQIYIDDSTFYVATAKELESSSYNRWTVTIHRMKSYCEDVGTYALMVGNGQNLNNTSNALALDWDGNAYLMGDVYVVSTGRGQNGTKVATEEFVTSKGYLTSVPSEYITENELTAKNYASKNDIPTAITTADIDQICV